VMKCIDATRSGVNDDDNRGAGRELRYGRSKALARRAQAVSILCHRTTVYPMTTSSIPFQYVRDGCYARAHQMHRIITTRYPYCCEKVFSFEAYPKLNRRHSPGACTQLAVARQFIRGGNRSLLLCRRSGDSLLPV
jgi:hypothetical protein